MSEQASQKTDPVATTISPLIAHALLNEDVVVDEHCVGSRLTVLNMARLAELIAIIAMGQAAHASKIIDDLSSPAAPALKHTSLIDAAKFQVQISGTTDNQKDASRWRRDGFLLEAISWIAARQSLGPGALLKDPHLKSTTQGIDGLMIEWASKSNEVVSTTICEDKCSEDPRKMFRDEVMKAFQNHHQNKRSPELVAIAASLIEKRGVSGTVAVEAATRVIDLKYRRYRAALAVEAVHDSEPKRKKLFKNYADLAGISAKQRIGATFVVPIALREYFDSIAAAVCHTLDSWS